MEHHLLSVGWKLFASQECTWAVTVSFSLTEQPCDKQLTHQEYNARMHTQPQQREIWRDEMCIIL